MVEHQLIYSPERKNNGHIQKLQITSSLIIWYRKQWQYLSLCLALILLHHVRKGFLFASPHDSLISAGFQLTLFTRARWARPFFPTLPRTNSRKLWIQATGLSLSGTFPLSGSRGSWLSSFFAFRLFVPGPSSPSDCLGHNLHVLTIALEDNISHHRSHGLILNFDVEVVAGWSGSLPSSCTSLQTSLQISCGISWCWLAVSGSPVMFTGAWTECYCMLLSAVAGTPPPLLLNSQVHP
jgi:hypothetical protein